MQHHPPSGNPPPPQNPGGITPVSPDLSDTLETATGGLKAKWSSLEMPIKIGLVVGSVAVFAVFARYIVPAMLAALGIGALLAVLFVPYWLPTIIAFFRGHPNKAVIALVNFFFGWTFIGWFISLFWSLTDPATGGQSVVVNVTNSAVSGATPQYQPQPALGYPPQYNAMPQPQPLAQPQYRVGDVVNGHRFDGSGWVPEGAPQQAPFPAPAQQTPPPPQA